jgi:hypothetical protein
MQQLLMGSAEIPQLYWKEAIYQEAVLMVLRPREICAKSVGYICGLPGNPLNHTIHATHLGVFWKTPAST